MLVTRLNFDEVFQKLKGEHAVLDVESTGLDAWGKTGKPADQACGIALRVDEQDYYFSLRHSSADNLLPEQLEMLVKRISGFETLIGHNLKFDLQILAKDNLWLPQTLIDTMVGYYLMDEHGSRGLKYLADRFLEKGSSSESSKLSTELLTRGLGPDEMWRLPPEMVAPYACKDVELTDKLDSFISERIYSQQLWEEFCDFNKLLAKMERWGLWTNQETIAQQKSKAWLNYSAALGQIHEMTGYPLNPFSSKQVTYWLGTEDSREETLAKAEHPGAKHVLEARAWLKGINTYYDPYLLWPGGTIHTDMKVCGTVSGRLATAHPNLQAVPNTPEQRVRNVFQPRPGYRFAELDYSQAEIRVGAHYTGDETLIEGFKRGGDAHQMVADRINRDRRTGKMINLALSYGMGTKKLGEKLNISHNQAMTLMSDYHNAFPKTRPTMNKAQEVAATRGYITLWSGRRCHFNHKDSDPKDAFNRLLQGSVACMVRRAMLRIDEEVPNTDARMLLQVHDSLLLEVKEGMEREVIPHVKRIMEDQPWCKCPIKVDAKIGKSWGEMEDHV